MAVHSAEEGMSPETVACFSFADSFHAFWLRGQQASAVDSHNHVSVAWFDFQAT